MGKRGKASLRTDSWPLGVTWLSPAREDYEVGGSKPQHSSPRCGKAGVFLHHLSLGITFLAPPASFPWGNHANQSLSEKATEAAGVHDNGICQGPGQR